MLGNSRGRFSAHGDFTDLSKIIDEIAFSRSKDGGLTWSPPVKINQTPANLPLGNRQAFVPNIAVAADGTLAVTYYDFRFHQAGGPLATDLWGVFCRPGADCANPASWGREVRLTAHSFDMRQAHDAAGYFVGDYNGLQSNGLGFVSAYAAANPSFFSTVFFHPLARPSF